MAINGPRTGSWNILLIAGTFGFLAFIHLVLLAPGVDAGIHLYGSFLLTKGLWPYAHLWNNKPFLIYVIGLPGFLYKSNPFLGERVLELGALGLDCWLLAGITRAVGGKRPAIYVWVFLVLYLLCWDQGFLTETFVLPLTLWYARAFARKSGRTVWIGGIALILASLLKQNGAVIIAGIALVDIATGYRCYAPRRKALYYAAIFLGGIALTALLLQKAGLLHDVVDQIFVYNSERVQRPGPWRWIRIQLRENSFLSYHGLSLQLLLNAWMVVIVWRAIARKPQNALLTVCAALYLAAYPLVYLSGKTYAHYFLLLILPATFVLGDLVEHRRAAKVALLALLAWGIGEGIGAIPGNKAVQRDMTAVAARIRATTSDTQPINLAGFGNQYIYVRSNRLCNTRFILPLLENNGYTDTYRNILDTDFTRNPPAYIILNKNNYRGLDPGNYYTQLIMARIPGYRLEMENGSFIVFSSKVPLESTNRVP